MTFAIAILAVIANAFGRRFAGGLLSQWVGPIGGTQVARLIQATIAGGTALACLLLIGSPAPVAAQPYGVPAVALGTAALTFLGAMGGFPSGMIPDLRFPFIFGSLGGLVLHGLMAVGPLAVAAYMIDLPAWWLLAAGVLRAPAYVLALFVRPHVPALGMLDVDPPPFAEFLSGAMLGLAIVLTLAT